MRRILNIALMLASAVMLSTGCVPGNSDSSSAGLAHEPGSPCDPSSDDYNVCPDGGQQWCQPGPDTWGECTDNATCEPPGGLHEVPPGTTGPCTSGEWQRCNIDGPDADALPGDGAAGFQVCGALGTWLDCGPCGDVVPQSDPPDGGPPAPCGGDPSIDTACRVAVGGCVRDGTWLCNETTNTRYCSAMAGMSMTEICDNVDNDCDGVTDDDVTRSCYTGPMGTAGVGECRLGFQTCTAGVWDTACSGEVTPVPEDCSGSLHDNGMDEDCSGSDLECLDCGGDTSPGASCATGRGACVATGSYVCNPDGTIECDAVAGAGTAEECNGIDDDCDGTVDDSPPGARGPSDPGGDLPWVDDCYTDSSGMPLDGAPDLLPRTDHRCQSGTRMCTGGSWDSCVGAIGPIAEICDNGIDDDCDGHIDRRDVVDCPGGGSGGSDAGVPMADAGSSGGMDAGTPMTDAGSGSGSDAGTGGGSDSGSGSTGNAAERAACEADRLLRGWVGTHSVSMDLACLDSTLGTCATGWQVIIWDGEGCEVPSDPGVNTLTISSDNDAPGNLTRVGARCGGTGTGREWPGPMCSLPATQCVTAFESNGTSRLADGFVMSSPSGALLPTFPSGTGGSLSCTP